MEKERGEGQREGKDGGKGLQRDKEVNIWTGDMKKSKKKSERKSNIKGREEDKEKRELGD